MNQPSNFSRDKTGQAQFFDYDRCEYYLNRDPENPDMLKFAFRSDCAKQILENGGNVMLDALYKDNMLPESEHFPGYDVTLGIDTSNLAKTLSKYPLHANITEVKKTMSEEEANEIREQNEQIRAKRETHADEVASKFAKFKRDFLGAPILAAMNNMEAGKDGFKPC